MVHPNDRKEVVATGGRAKGPGHPESVRRRAGTETGARGVLGGWGQGVLGSSVVVHKGPSEGRVLREGPSIWAWEEIAHQEVTVATAPGTPARTARVSRTRTPSTLRGAPPDTGRLALTALCSGGCTGRGDARPVSLFRRKKWRAIGVRLVARPDLTHCPSATPAAFP